MQSLLSPFRVIYKIYFLLYFIISLILFYPFFKYQLADPARFPKAFKLMRFYARLWHFFAMIPVRVTGDTDPLKDGPCLILCNHSSFLDIPCIYVVFKQYFLIAGKREIENWPLFNIFYTSGMNILVDRQNKRGSVLSLKQMIREIDKGHPIALFPEGTISPRAPHLIDFKSGAFSMAVSKQIPIIPVTFVTNWKRLQRKKFLLGQAGPGFADVVVHEPVYTKNLTKKDVHNLLKKVRKIINKPLYERWGATLD
jgi:1-acyl-sn-glycerol-3-phosphate acyltransferase